MHYDFWNNPLVVTAMRLKFRRGSPGMRAVIWILMLLGLGALLHHISQTQNFRFPTAYLVAILSVQCVVSAAMAVTTTSTSMNAEVINRTLDFQRIVTLTPREILLGKMIGEPSFAYFLLLASIPLAALCWGLGAASGLTILFLYVNIATFTLMWAAIGLINSLQPPSQASGKQRTGGGGVGMVLMFAIVPQLLIHGVRLMDRPGIGDVLQLLTPLGSLIHLWRDDAWQAQVSFWGVRFPSLVAAPVVQLAIAAWVIAAMSRRLKNLLDPILTKPRAYATVLALDLAIAGICYARWIEGYDPTQLVYGYGLAHLVVCFIMMFFVVPRSAALVAWLWRRDRRESWLKQLLTADRSDVCLASVVLALIGLAVLMVALVLPIQAIAGRAMASVDANRLLEVVAATFVLVVAMGVIHQLCVAAAPRGGTLLYLLFILAANLLPPVTAALLAAAEDAPPDVEKVSFLSPVVLYSVNMTSVAGRHISAVWVIGLYSVFAIVGYALLRRWLGRESATVERKLQGIRLA
jgi:hypothetical protein